MSRPTGKREVNRRGYRTYKRLNQGQVQVQAQQVVKKKVEICGFFTNYEIEEELYPPPGQDYRWFRIYYKFIFVWQLNGEQWDELTKHLQGRKKDMSTFAENWHELKYCDLKGFKYFPHGGITISFNPNDVAPPDIGTFDDIRIVNKGKRILYAQKWGSIDFKCPVELLRCPIRAQNFMKQYIQLTEADANNLKLFLCGVEYYSDYFGTVGAAILTVISYCGVKFLSAFPVQIQIYSASLDKYLDWALISLFLFWMFIAYHGFYYQSYDLKFLDPVWSQVILGCIASVAICITLLFLWFSYGYYGERKKRRKYPTELLCHEQDTTTRLYDEDSNSKNLIVAHIRDIPFL